MKVLLFARPSTGGAARHVHDVVGGLADRHDLSALVSPLEDPRFPDRLRAAGACVTELPLSRTPAPISDRKGLAALRAEVRRVRPDLIHAHSFKAGFLARLLSDGPPVVYSPHGYFHLYPSAPAGGRSLARIVERGLERRAAVIALSAEWERRHVGLSDRAVVVPNGIPLPTAPSGAEIRRVREELGVAADMALVLWVGRLKAPKDPFTFIRAAAQCHRAARFVLCGTGPELPACRRAAGDGVLVTGERADVPKLQHAADVVVLCSDFEAAPYGLLEAMAAGTPVVATDLPATREILGEAGTLVPPRKPELLARALTDLLANPTRTNDLAHRARDRIRRLYSPEAMLTATESAWHQALNH